METEEKENLKFEEAMDKLEEIVQKLESGGLALDDSLAKFTEGVKLVKFCNQELNKAEKKIEMVLKEDGEYGEIVPFTDKEEE